MRVSNKKEWFTVTEMREALKKGGLEWTEVWIRQQIGDGKIKSEKKFNSRIIHWTEIQRIIHEREISRERV